MQERGIPVGREEELAQFRQVLEEDDGRVILIVGQEGMGKTFLARWMLEQAEDNPIYDCRWVRYEVLEQQTVESFMEQVLQEAHTSAQVQGSLDGSAPRIRQLQALLKLAPKGGNLVELLQTLRNDVKRPAWVRLSEALREISNRLTSTQRAVFLIDPQTYLEPGSDDAWLYVAKRLPPRIKLLFPQRPADRLARNHKLAALPQVCRIPGPHLAKLAPESVDEYLSFCELGQHRALFERFAGHPYAMAAAASLLLDGMAPEDLPAEPTGVANAQWTRVCKEHPAAVPLLQAHAVLDVAVPDGCAAQVAGVARNKQRQLLSAPFLTGLLRAEDGNRSIYHALLKDEVLRDLDPEETKTLHERAIAYYKPLLEGDRPDVFAARRLPDHVLAARGNAAFVEAVAFQCSDPLRTQGLLEESSGLLRRGLDLSEEGSYNRGSLLNGLGLIYQIRGELEKAEEMHRKALELNEELGRKEGMAAQLGNLGVIYKARGELDKAEEMHKKALELDEELGRKEGMAIQLGNLGNIYEIRGELDNAEEMYGRSLKLEKEMGRKEGMAASYGNLGNIYQIRGELDKAEEMSSRALELNEELGRKQGMAIQLGNLGAIYQIRWKLDEAEEMHSRALELNEDLGRKQGMASQFGNLGIIYQIRGELDKAEEMHRKSLELEKELGSKQGMAADYGNLGIIYQIRGELDKAEEMHSKSLELEKELGSKQGMANQIGNLGLIYKTRGEIDKAEEMYHQALKIFEEMGHKENIAIACGNLADIHMARGDLDKAEELRSKAAQLRKEMGLEP